MKFRASKKKKKNPDKNHTTIKMQYFCTKNLNQSNYEYQWKRWVSVKQLWPSVGNTPMHKVTVDLPHSKLEIKTSVPAVQM